MNMIERLEMIQRLDGLIRRKATGKPAQLARRIRLSESGLYNLIGLMKRMDAPIYFCHRRNSYCYEFEVDFSIGFTKAKTIVGGIGNNISLPNLWSSPVYITN